MATKYYKCTLLSDVILNKSMATTGNVATLNYIPGSVFLGIVAKEIYGKTDKNDYDIFHSGKVKFGDATISNNGKPSYHYPICLYSDKLKPKGDKYLYHLLTPENYPKNADGDNIQLKLVRGGYFNLESKTELNITKRFSMKSERDKDTRKAQDAQLFGYEALKTGQSFVFTITYEDKSIVKTIEDALIGKKRIGKSKTAEYSLVEIKEIEEFKHQCISEEKYTLVYANSHLCFFDENGQPNLQPTTKDLGVEGTVDWKKSHVRTYEYTSWNGKRNTPNAQRFCIARGSVFYIDKKNEGKTNFVGEYQAEGLGHILVNPSFLFEVKENNVWDVAIKEEKNNTHNSTEEPSTNLGKLLHKKKSDKEDELKLSKEILKSLTSVKDKFKRITKSQWGSIRAVASSAKTPEDMNALFFKIIKDNEGENKKVGILNSGVAYDRYWSKDNNIENLKNIIKGKSCEFVAKFASEMAKKNQKKESNGRK